MRYKAGDIVLIPFPFSDLNTRKKRPVLVIRSADRYGDFIGLAVTTAPQHEAAWMLEPEHLSTGALPKISYVRLDKVFTLSENLIVGRPATVKETVLNRIIQMMCDRIEDQE